MNVGVIGTGYVGLVQGLGLASLYKHNVICADINQEKIKLLQQKKLSIYEPELEDWLKESIISESIQFTTDIEKTCLESDIIFICVGTPPDKNYGVDLTAVANIAQQISMWATKYKNHENSFTQKGFIIKSTVPPGTTRKYFRSLEESGLIAFAGHNPEFLREGNACFDFKNQDRIIFGLTNPLADVYYPNLLNQIYNTDNYSLVKSEESELIKYGNNCFLTIKLAFANEIQEIASSFNADPITVLNLIGADNRIVNKHLTPGTGLNGSCFPKDCPGLVSFSKANKIEATLVQTALNKHKYQTERCTSYIRSAILNFQPKKISFLGTSFKENTDDMRESRAIDIIKTISNQFGKNLDIIIHNPIGNSSDIKITNDINETKDSDMFIILTPWDQYKQKDIYTKHSKIIDLRYLIPKIKESDYSIFYLGDKLE